MGTHLVTPARAPSAASRPPSRLALPHGSAVPARAQRTPASPRGDRLRRRRIRGHRAEVGGRLLAGSELIGSLPRGRGPGRGLPGSARLEESPPAAFGARGLALPLGSDSYPPVPQPLSPNDRLLEESPAARCAGQAGPSPVARQPRHPGSSGPFSPRRSQGNEQALDLEQSEQCRLGLRFAVT